jgi:hypothetical protein
MRGGIDDEFPQRAIQRVPGIGAIEPLISIATTGDELGCFELRELILHRLQGKKCEARQLTHIELLPRIGEQQPEHLRPDDREELVEKCLTRHSRIILDRIKRPSQSATVREYGARVARSGSRADVHGIRGAV